MTLKTTMLVIAGLLLGLVGGGAAGIGVGFAWSELIQNNQDIGPTVLTEIVPFSALVGALAGGALFGVISLRDADINIEQPLNERD